MDILGTYFERLRRCSLLIAIISCPNFAYAQAEDPPQIQFLTGSNVQLKEVPQSELIDIYLGRKKFWPDKSKITVIVYQSDTPESKLIEPVINRSSLYLTRHWRRLVFTGNGIMPVMVNSEEEMIEMLNTIPNSIGYARTDPQSIEISPLKVLDSKSPGTMDDSLQMFFDSVEEFVIFDGFSDKPTQTSL